MLPLDCLFFTVAKLLVIVWMNEWMSFLCHTQAEPQDIRPIRTIWQHYSYTDSTHKKLSCLDLAQVLRVMGVGKRHFPLLRLRLGVPSASEESNRFATLEVMDIILVKTKYHYITIILNTWILHIWTVYNSEDVFRNKNDGAFGTLHYLFCLCLLKFWSIALVKN